MSSQERRDGTTCCMNLIAICWISTWRGEQAHQRYREGGGRGEERREEGRREGGRREERQEGNDGTTCCMNLIAICWISI